MHVCLFDIDGTLVNTSGAGQAAMQAALRTVLNVERAAEGIPTAGRTDYAITADLFAHFQVEVSDDLWARFQAAYLEHLSSELAQRSGRVLPGIVRLLEQLSGRGDVQLGLLTGNYRDGARLKLEYFHLAEHFRFGAFGDCHVHRDDVARDARRTVHQIAPGLPDDRLWVIGDTPADIQCGKAINARVVAVATGSYNFSDLEAEQPEFLFRDLSEERRLLELLNS
ncbi:MAG: haloacid dehalogenase-like hydrolase [Planctomycetaceae bacterium]|nr:haloacid dehalogenase-like hydrolase [Planctomycetaceae bacterium]